MAALKLTGLPDIGTALASTDLLTVDKVHEMSNGTVGIQKKRLMEATAALAANTLSKVDEAGADIAMKEYLEHMRCQKVVEGKIVDGKPLV